MDEHTHDLRIDPYTWYPPAPLGDGVPVKVVCIVPECPTEFIGALFYTPHNKETWPRWSHQSDPLDNAAPSR